MKKKIEMKKKFTMCAVGIATVACIIAPTKASAALQANKNPGNSDTIDNWLLNVRKMESTGGTLGLSDDTINTDLTSTTKNNLDILSYSEKATTSSRKHSEDMMIKNYFDHINKENKSPFNRMEEEGINYKNAGENIAAGQSSAIYAHHAWMNSLGHRKNILGDYKYIGVGVIFGGYYNIYYTQNFYT